MADKTRESALWTAMHNGLKAMVRRGELEINRVENKARKSMADTEGHVARPGHGQFWIELKTAHRPARRTTPIRFVFQEGQSNWLSRRWEMGGNAYLLVQVGKAHERRLYLIKGCDAHLVEEGVTEDSLRGLSCALSDRPTFEQVVLEASFLR